ncbi:MAG: mRNA-degrading endonuclease [Alcanivorax sp.]|nr:mRNA-degrading endonuclease [Alcanivorax sp.]
MTSKAGKRYTPERGDIVWCDFDPTRGHEQAHHRPALVLSPRRFNQVTGLTWLIPITNTVRGHGLEVAVHGGTVKGVALVQQLRTVDHAARQLAFVERATPKTIAEALSKARAVLTA